jgi:hypothetical protein
MKKLLVIASLLSVACGRQEIPAASPHVDEIDEVEKLRQQVLDLSGSVSQINSLVLSDWSTCTAAGADALSTLQQNICRIAQAATIEAKTQLKGELASYVTEQEREITALSNRLDSVASASDVVQLKTDLYGNATGATCAVPLAGSVCARLNSIEGRVTTLESTVNNPSTGVGALNTAVANINAQLVQVINGAMIEITIGRENLLASPLYESVLRNPARSRITAYIDSNDANKTVSSVATTNASSTVVVTSTAHGYLVGNTIKHNGVLAVGGLSSAQLNDQVIITAVTANTYSYVASTAATSTATGGGSNGYVFRVNGRGLGMAWQTVDGEVLLQTTFSYKPYKFLVTGASTVFAAAPGGALPNGWAGLTPGSGFVCYSITLQNTTASVIKAGGSDIRCY